MITLHFHLQPQYKYELFHINFTYTCIYCAKWANYSLFSNLTNHLEILLSKGGKYSFWQNFSKYYLSSQKNRSKGVVQMIADLERPCLYIQKLQRFNVSMLVTTNIIVKKQSQLKLCKLIIEVNILYNIASRATQSNSVTYACSKSRWCTLMA